VSDAGSGLGWLCFLLAGLFEVGFTTSMRYMDWPPRPWPVVAFVICVGLSFGLLIAAMRTIPLGTAYAAWTGIGAAGTAVLGILWYGEPAETARILLLMLLIGSIVGLKLVTAG
jgi:quaternary ammonium compound-resistance protein SugE